MTGGHCESKLELAGLRVIDFREAVHITHLVTEARLIIKHLAGRARARVQRPMTESNSPCVVAIGASAGGLAAFQQLIENLPTDTGMAFVLLSHILRGSTSLLPEILSRSTQMPVIQITGKEQLRGNHIYVLPPDRFLEIQGDSLLLIPRPERGANSAINHFLFSLAQDQAHGSIGIILSGEGTDGSEGLKLLKEMGGVTMAQKPTTASSEAMPISAILIDHVDYILSPKDIALKLGSKEWCEAHLTPSLLNLLWVRNRAET